MSVVGTRVNTECGDGLLVEDDTLVFTFSEVLDAGALADAETSIVAAVNAALDTGAIDAGDVVAIGGNIAFLVTLPQAAELDTQNAIAFDLDVTNVEDENGVDAVTLQATLAPTDVLRRPSTTS